MHGYGVIGVLGVVSTRVTFLIWGGKFNFGSFSGGTLGGVRV